MTDFEIAFTALQTEIHTNAVNKGFWESSNVGEKIALVHSEVSEALEAFRSGNPTDDKLIEYDSAVVELADAVIRIMDLAGSFDMNLAGAIVAKVIYNSKRPYKHGKAF